MVAERSFSLEPFWYFWLLGNNLPRPKAKNVFVSSLLLLGLSVTSFARIGETMDEAVKRYGEVVHHGNIHGEEVYSFTKNGFNILAHFHGGKIDRILYRRESRGKLSDEEIDTFLRANPTTAGDSQSGN
jgi:hypothetical protein